MADRVRAGRRPRLTDAELLTPAVAQVLPGVRSEARWLRLVPAALPGALSGRRSRRGQGRRGWLRPSRSAQRSGPSSARHGCGGIGDLMRRC
jgi:hypothetical protein